MQVNFEYSFSIASAAVFNLLIGELLPLLTASLIYLTQESELKNESKGIYYMELAAKANIPIAQYNLGRMYAKLKGFEFDSMTYNKDKAIMWFEKAAQNNIFPAKDALRKLR